MRHGDYREEPHTLNRADQNDSLKDYVWGTSEEARLRSLSLYLIKSIVEKYGGTIRVDLATDTINIDVPKEKEVACAQEIEEQVGSMCC